MPAAATKQPRVEHRSSATSHLIFLTSKIPLMIRYPFHISSLELASIYPYQVWNYSVGRHGRTSYVGYGRHIRGRAKAWPSCAGKTYTFLYSSMEPSVGRGIGHTAGRLGNSKMRVGRRAERAEGRGCFSGARNCCERGTFLAAQPGTQQYPPGSA